MGNRQGKDPESDATVTALNDKRGGGRFLRRQGSNTTTLVSARQLGQFDAEYDIRSELGSGITGTVYVVTNKRGQEMAMKTINLNRVRAAQLKELRLEVNLLKELDHPNIIKLVEVFESTSKLMLIMDLCKGGHLASPAAGQRLRSERNVANVICQILLAIKYCHEHNVVHRDIKLENVLFTSDDPASLHVQLIDFGLSGLERKPTWGFTSKKSLLTATCGTIYYMAPEVFQGKYDSRCDLWSVGVLTYMLLTGGAPFRGRTEKETIVRIARTEAVFTQAIWPKLNPHASALVKNLLQRNPETRWTAAQALGSPWFEKSKKDVGAHDVPLEEGVVRSLAKFVSYGVLKRTVLHVIAHHASGKELSELKKAFLSLDVDASGTITLGELKQMLIKHGMGDEEANRLFQNVDLDESGEIQLSEFLAATVEATVILDRERYLEAFHYLSNGEAYITVRHLEDLLGKMNKSQWKDLIRDIDADGDGRISLDEFLALIEEGQGEEVGRVMGGEEEEVVAAPSPPQQQ